MYKVDCVIQNIIIIIYYHPEGVGYQKRPFVIRLIALQGARNDYSMSICPRKIGSQSTSAVGSTLVFNERGKTWEGFRPKKM